jgi:hypothetical protein
MAERLETANVVCANPRHQLCNTVICLDCANDGVSAERERCASLPIEPVLERYKQSCAWSPSTAELQVFSRAWREYAAAIREGDDD